MTVEEFYNTSRQYAFRKDVAAIRTDLQSYAKADDVRKDFGHLVES